MSEVQQIISEKWFLLQFLHLIYKCTSYMCVHPTPMVVVWFFYNYIYASHAFFVYRFVRMVSFLIILLGNNNFKYVIYIHVATYKLN